MFRGEAENVLRAVNIGENGMHRIVHHQFDADRRGEMDHRIALRNQRFEKFGVGHHIRFHHP